MLTQKEKIKQTINGIIEGDQDCFQEFYDDYGAIVKLHANKWQGFLYSYTKCLYDFDDIESEMWEAVLNKLHYYDPSKGAVTTWMYQITNQEGMRIRDRFAMKKRCGGHSQASIDKVVYEESDTKLIDLLIDKDSALIDDHIVSMDSVVDTLYKLKCFLETLTPKQKEQYKYYLLGYSVTDTQKLIGTTRQNISYNRIRIIEKSNMVINSKMEVNKESSYSFFSVLFSKRITKKMLKEHSCSKETIDICRGVLKSIGIRSSSFSLAS